jgi:hypothetical protein
MPPPAAAAAAAAARDDAADPPLRMLSTLCARFVQRPVSLDRPHSPSPAGHPPDGRRSDGRRTDGRRTDPLLRGHRTTANCSLHTAHGRSAQGRRGAREEPPRRVRSRAGVRSRASSQGVIASAPLQPVITRRRRPPACDRISARRRPHVQSWRRPHVQSWRRPHVQSWRRPHVRLHFVQSSPPRAIAGGVAPACNHISPRSTAFLRGRAWSSRERALLRRGALRYAISARNESQERARACDGREDAPRALPRASGGCSRA